MIVATTIPFTSKAHRAAVGFALLLALLPKCAVAQATRPADPLEQRIASLIFDLDAPDPYLRDRVTEELLQIGPEVIEPLRRALEDPPTPEFQARAQLILAELPKRWKHIREGGGAVVAGLQAVLRASPDPCRAGEPLHLNLEIAAVGLRRAALCDLRALDIEFTPDRASTSPLAEGRLVIRRLGAAGAAPAATPLLFDRGQRRTIDLEPGGAIRTALPLHEACELPAGDYEIRLVYYAGSQKLVAGATKDLESNTVRVTIRP